MSQQQQQQEEEEEQCKSKTKTKTTAGRRRKLIINQRNAARMREGYREGRCAGELQMKKKAMQKEMELKKEEDREPIKPSELSRGVIYAPTTAKANESHILTLCQDGRRGREGGEAEGNTAATDEGLMQAAIKRGFTEKNCGNE